MKGMKLCPKCGVEKSNDQFFKNKARYDGLSGYCKECQKVSQSALAQRLRLEVIDLLGGPVCKRCGFSDVRALVIDHKAGGGTRHRVDAVSAWGVYRHAKLHPDEYQVLCWNCNHIKRHEEGEWASTTYMAKVLAAPRESVTRPVRWARDFDACTECGTTVVPHQGKGLCRNCFQSRYRGPGQWDRVQGHARRGRGVLPDGSGSWVLCGCGQKLVGSSAAEAISAWRQHKKGLVTS